MQLDGDDDDDFAVPLKDTKTGYRLAQMACGVNNAAFRGEQCGSNEDMPRGRHTVRVEPNALPIMCRNLPTKKAEEREWWLSMYNHKTADGHRQTLIRDLRDRDNHTITKARLRTSADINGESRYMRIMEKGIAVPYIQCVTCEKVFTYYICERILPAKIVNHKCVKLS